MVATACLGLQHLLRRQQRSCIHRTARSVFSAQFSNETQSQRLGQQSHFARHQPGICPTQGKPSSDHHAPRLIRVSAAWTKAATQTELADAGGKKVVELSVGRVLLADVSGKVFAVSNKCSHLGLPLVGKTAMFQAEISDKCVVCPAHGTAFDLTTGQVKGEWCPKLPDLPIIGKGPKEKPLPTYECRVTEDGDIEVNV